MGKHDPKCLSWQFLLRKISFIPDRELFLMLTKFFSLWLILALVLSLLRDNGVICAKMILAAMITME
jgi:hypothetical protein